MRRPNRRWLAPIYRSYIRRSSKASPLYRTRFRRRRTRSHVANRAARRSPRRGEGGRGIGLVLRCRLPRPVTCGYVRSSSISDHSTSTSRSSRSLGTASSVNSSDSSVSTTLTTYLLAITSSLSISRIYLPCLGRGS
jgi:hypothetical protein